MNLSILVPVYNEEKTIGKVLDKLEDLKINKVKVEVIIIDDGSSDSTSEIVNSRIKSLENFFYKKQSKNLGKGAAIKTGIKIASHDYILVQDADLEYNPTDIPKLIDPILKQKAQVVFGTRLNRWPNFRRDENNLIFFIHYLGNRLLSLITSILYGVILTDMETGYKLFPKQSLEKFDIKANGFDFEPEITSKLLKAGYSIIEVPISTRPRGYKEGKKLDTIKDGLRALYTLFKFRFIDKL